MRKAILLGISLFLALGAYASNHGDWFNLRNETGKTITGVWLSPHGREKWDSPISFGLGLANLEDAPVPISDTELSPTDRYDLKLTLDNGTPVELPEGFNPLTSNNLVVHLQGNGKPWIEYRD
jgi:hypothetical protein